MNAEFAAVREIALLMLEKGEFALSGARGSKTAHKDMRRLSNDLSKALPALRKASIAASSSEEEK
jgi:hypothetical protein